MSIPYIPKVSEKIRRIARKYKIKTAFKTQNTLRQHLTKVKPANEEQDSRNCVYSVKCECSRQYIGETGRPLQTRIKEHMRNTKIGDTVNSKLAKHVHENNHKVSWKETAILHKEPHYYKRKFIEASLIKLDSSTISQSSIEVRPVWVPMLREHLENSKKHSPPNLPNNERKRIHPMSLRGTSAPAVPPGGSR